MTIPVTRVPNVRKMGCSVGRMVKGQILFAAPSTEHSHRPERVGCGLQGQISLQAQTCSDRNDHCFEGHNGNGHRLGQNPPIRACRSQLKSFYPSIYILCTSVWNFFFPISIYTMTIELLQLQKFRKIFLLQKTVQSHFPFSSASHCLYFRNSPLQYHRRHYHHHLYSQGRVALPNRMIFLEKI